MPHVLFTLMFGRTRMSCERLFTAIQSVWNKLRIPGGIFNKIFFWRRHWNLFYHFIFILLRTTVAVTFFVNHCFCFCFMKQNSMNICQTENCFGNSTDNMKQTLYKEHTFLNFHSFFYIIKQKEGTLCIFVVTHLIWTLSSERALRLFKSFIAANK